MMTILLTILGMIFVGAVIGGFTNSLAIKMLFRPYEAKYIGKWRVPFTPGLIPKRRDELAHQLGLLVVNHLVTPETIRNKLKSDQYEKEVILFLQDKLDLFFQRNFSVGDLSYYIGISLDSNVVEERIHQWANNKIHTWYENHKKYSLEEIVPDSILHKLEMNLPSIAQMMLNRGKDFFASSEGKQALETLVSNFFENKGMLWNMVQMFFGQSSIAEKLQPEITKFLDHEGTEIMIISILQKEWGKLKTMDLERVVEWIGKDDIDKGINTIIRSWLNIQKLRDVHVPNLLSPYRTFLKEQLVPRVISKIRDWLIHRVDDVMDKLQVAEMVKAQVESFPVHRLEEMVLSITKKELKMITFLGALIGGIIGLFQGIVVMMLG